jgi:hypothetical protein
VQQASPGLGRIDEVVAPPRGRNFDEDATMAVSTHWKVKGVFGGVLLALGVTCAAPALAQSWKINNGRNTGALLPTETRKMPDGGTYLTGGSRQLVETEDPTYPITGQSMDCRWMCRIMPNGKDGNCITLCAGVDKDGDLFSFRALAFGAGSYEVGPGTGKYARASGGGTFETVYPDDSALAHVRWKGTLNLK